MSNVILSRIETADELAEALYYAHASAAIVVSEDPHAAPQPAEWEELAATVRALWEETARRLIALNG